VPKIKPAFRQGLLAGARRRRRPRFYRWRKKKLTFYLENPG